jgi:hypothetical protein
MVAVVAHQEDMARRNGDFGIVVERLLLVVDHAIGCAIGQGLAKDRQFAEIVAGRVAKAQAGKSPDRTARWHRPANRAAARPLAARACR